MSDDQIDDERVRELAAGLQTLLFRVSEGQLGESLRSPQEAQLAMREVLEMASSALRAATVAKCKDQTGTVNVTLVAVPPKGLRWECGHANMHCFDYQTGGQIQC